MRLPGPRRPAEPGPSQWVEAALKAYEDRNLTRVTVARTLMSAAILVWIYVNYGPAIAAENLAPITLFVLFGLAAYALVHGRPQRLWLQYPFVVLDALLLGWLFFRPGGIYPVEWPWPIALRLPTSLFLLTILALAALTFRPGLVL
jgi:adenylate cyclase